MGVSISGLNAVQNALASLHADAQAAATSALNETADLIAREAKKRTLSEYNIKPEALDRAISVSLASAGRTHATVTLKVKAIPFEEFSPTVQMVEFDVAAFGKYKARRQLPTVKVRYRKGGQARVIPGAFPLRQRESGALQAGEVIRKRTGRSRRNLTVLRYFTFPKRHMERLLPELEKLGGDNLQIRFDAAYRDRRGRLRRNDG